MLIAYDRDDAGERGAAKVAERLMAEGMDANEYAQKVQPAAKSPGLLIRKAAWLGKGNAPTSPDTAPLTMTAAAKDETPTPQAEASAPASEGTVPGLTSTRQSQVQFYRGFDVLHVCFGKRAELTGQSGLVRRHDLVGNGSTHHTSPRFIGHISGKSVAPFLRFDFARPVRGHRPIPLVECGVDDMRFDQFLDELTDSPLSDQPVQAVVYGFVQSNRHFFVHGALQDTLYV